MGKVLVGVDFSSEGQAALAEGIAEAERRGAEVIFLHYVRVGADEQTRPRQQRAEAFLQKAVSRAESADVDARCIVEVGVSSAASQLLKVADKESVDVIVVGTRRRTRVGKALMGGDAQQVIIGATCPVLCVKASGDPDGTVSGLQD